MTDPKQERLRFQSRFQGSRAGIVILLLLDTPTDLEDREGTPATITWNAVALAKDKTFRTYITGVRVQDEGGTLPFTATVGRSDAREER